MNHRIFIFIAALLALAGCGKGNGDIQYPDENKALTKNEAEAVREKVIADWKTERMPLADKVIATKAQWTPTASLKNAKPDWNYFQVTDVDKHIMRFFVDIYGSKPADGRSLWISLHGGGEDQAAGGKNNDGQWDNQRVMYLNASPAQPQEGVYVAPRAYKDTYDLWYFRGNDGLFRQIIETMVLKYDVNPDKVYLMGYSAGGDGVWRLAPRLADHWASASMMAGHPGDVGLVNVRNLPYTIWVGELDAAYNRNVLVRQRGVQLDSLQKGDPEGYVHECHVMEGMPHWMKLKDAAAVPWMAQYRRNPYPTKVAWQQEAVLKHSFYWLQIPVDEMARGKRVIAQIADNVITISECDYSRLTILLNDEMVNLDKSVKVVMNGKTLFKGKVRRTMENLRKTLSERNDPSYVFPSAIDVAIKK